MCKTYGTINLFYFQKSNLFKFTLIYSYSLLISTHQELIKKIDDDFLLSANVQFFNMEHHQLIKKLPQKQ